jgi:hypothetical protein
MAGTHYARNIREVIGSREGAHTSSTRHDRMRTRHRHITSECVPEQYVREHTKRPHVDGSAVRLSCLCTQRHQKQRPLRPLANLIIFLARRNLAYHRPSKAPLRQPARQQKTTFAAVPLVPSTAARPKSAILTSSLSPRLLAIRMFSTTRRSHIASSAISHTHPL